MTANPLQTEVEFELPKGYVDGDGTLHREGVMRLATAADEIKPLTDPRVKSNPSYLSVVLLSRVVTRLGDLEEVTPHVVENLFVTDLAYLQELYARVNEYGADVVEAVCPECGEAFEAPVDHREHGSYDAVDTGVTSGNSRPGEAGPEEDTVPPTDRSPRSVPTGLTVGEPVHRDPESGSETE